MPLSGLSLRQALDILRSSPAVTVLQVISFKMNLSKSNIYFIFSPGLSGHGQLRKLLGRAARGSEAEILDSAELLLWPGVCARHGRDPDPAEAGGGDQH